MASASRMWLRNLLPRPSPWLAPATSPPMSTNCTVAGTTLRLWLMAARASSLGSGTRATPTLGSVVAKAYGAASAPPPASALYSEDFPALGSPTNPNRSIGLARVRGPGSAPRTRPVGWPAMTATLSPADALDRVVYLLDRALAEGRRVQAYAKARDLVRDLGDDEIAQRHADGTLLELPGIGPSTGYVIAMALDGGIDEYLGDLEEETAIEVGEGAELRAALKGDCHSHTLWSDGGAPVEVMARTAMALGHEYLVVTDHSPRLTIAHGLNRERLLEQLDEIERVRERVAPFRILTGIEVDILQDGGLDQDDDLLERLDVVVASVHSKLSMPEVE